MSAAGMDSLNSRDSTYSSHDPQVLGGERLVTPLKPLSILDWYAFCRVHHQWNIFQAIRYALWLITR
jgi:hypothetical protein